MFTSRAEYRILLRQDNADIRLTPIGHAIGMASDKALRRVKEKMSGAEKLKKSLRKEGVSPERANTVLARKKSAPVKQQVKLSSLITRPGIGMEDVLEMSVDSSVLATELNNVDPSIVTQTEIQLKYEGYISREEDVAKKMNRLEDVKIPEMIDYSKLTSLSAEAKEKLTALAPVTIGQASRISGISPSDVSVLLVYLGR
jgi:tRNA uridine 5-carboxymethylaminomethyl modification enzyme